MKLALVCAVLLYFTSLASAQNIQIQAQPQTINFRENDMVIVCSITNPSQLNAVYSIQLQRNSSTTFETLVSVANGLTPPLQWKDSALRNRATATGSVDSPSTAQLRLTIDKNSVQCPTDFKMYMCKISAFSNVASETVTQETSPVPISYIIKPAVIEMPRVRILNSFSDTPNRQFPVGTAIQLTCQGEVGSDASSTIRWCAQRANEMMFTGLPQTPIHSEASQSGCMFTRSSTITYNLTNDDTFTRFLCESGDTGMCGTGTAIQHVNITIEGSGNTNPRTADDTSDAGIIAGGVIGGLAALILIILLVYFLVLRRKSDGESYRTKEDVPGYNGPANPEGPVYSVPVKDNPPHERQELLEEREEDDHRVNGTTQEPRRELHYADLDIATQPPGTKVKPKPRPRHEPSSTEYASVTFGGSAV
ncbi:cell surface A33 antigen-like isoform X5 [Crassostrea angulata]|uniref:cell surface A33 antigen-like isoform X5 n=1 Tax=Magallana angulata TaxID=2784310 RepID=UPI0022B1D4AD|nr:cell surface A33 antigen-like isoform X5 [Crassostrea angulata]